MDKVIDLAKEISNQIYELPEAKEYLKLKKLIDEDEEIQQLQKDIIKLQNAGDEKVAEELLSRLNSIPLVINYKSVREELASSLKIVSDILK